MKKFFVLSTILAMAVTVVSCQKNLADNGASQVLKGDKAVVSLTLSGGSVNTKALQTADEAAVSDIQVFVFNGDVVDGYKLATADEVSALVVNVEATVGTRDVYAFVNAPSLESYTSKSALLAAVSLLSHNNSGKFVMGGKLEDQNVTASFAATVNVDRYASRVRISKITRKFKNKALQSVDFKITKLYLTSVVTNELYSFAAPDTYAWLNASFGASRALATSNSFVYNKLSSPASVAQDGSYITAHSFYGYANENDADDSNDPKTFKQTRLVVECQIDADNSGTFDDDEYFTYPIPLGALESNKSYEIQELIITRLGNHSNGDDNADDGEDDDILPADATFTIVVNDWTEVLVGGTGTVTI